MGHWYHFAEPTLATFRENGSRERVMVLAWRPYVDDDAKHPWDVHMIEYLTDLGERVSPLHEIEWML